jgi:adenylate cyclase
MGNFKEAIPVLKEAIRLNPDPPSWYQWVLDRSYAQMRASYYEMGASYYERDKFNEAIPFFEKALRIDPTTSSYGLELLANSYYKTGKYKDSIPVLKKAITLWSDNLEAHVGLAAAYSLAGRTEDAHAQAAEVLRINPKFSLEEDIAKNDYYDFLKDDKERFINTLRKAGLK